MRSYIKGIDRLERKLAKIQVSMADAATIAIEQGLDTIRQDAQQLAPFDSGDLRKSIYVVMNDNEGKVIVGVDYGAYVELGTSDSEAQPFLFPAYQVNKQAIKNDVIDGVRAAIKEITG